MQGAAGWGVADPCAGVMSGRWWNYFHGGSMMLKQEEAATKMEFIIKHCFGRIKPGARSPFPQGAVMEGDNYNNVSPVNSLVAALRLCTGEIIIT